MTAIERIKCESDDDISFVERCLQLNFGQYHKLPPKMQLKVARSPLILRSTNLESKVIEFFVFVVKFYHTVYFGSFKPFTVRKIGDFPHFLSALASNNQFIIKLVKMRRGGTLHVVVETFKISLDQLKKKRSLVECCSVSSCIVCNVCL